MMILGLANGQDAVLQIHVANLQCECLRYSQAGASQQSQQSFIGGRSQSPRQIGGTSEQLADFSRAIKMWCVAPMSRSERMSGWDFSGRLGDGLVFGKHPDRFQSPRLIESIGPAR